MPPAFWIATLAAGLINSMTDWLFMGDLLLRDAYRRNPEIWRVNDPKGERPAILWAILLGFVTTGGMIALLGWAGLVSYPRALAGAALIWLAVPLPLLLTNSLFMKLSSRVALVHAAGWLVKLWVTALAAAWAFG